MMSWETGCSSCDECGDVVDTSSDLTAVFGGIEADYREVAPGVYVSVECAYSIEVCPCCYQRHVNEVSFRLLSW